MDSLACGQATAVATCRWQLAKSRLSNPQPMRIKSLVGGGGFEPPKSKTTDLQSVPFGHSGNLPYEIFPKKKMELVDGLEPPTC